jgi:uncharacterized protein
MSQAEALEKVKSGEIAATALISGKPVRAISRLTGTDRLHFVPIPYPGQLISDYLPATLDHDDYPDLIALGETVDTVAVSTALIAYNWPKTNVDRYRRVQRFVEAFFPRIADFQRPPRHPKWHDVNLAATLPGWPRFEAAQAWLDTHTRTAARPPGTPAGGPATATSGPAARPSSAPPGIGAASRADQQRDVDPALFQEFLRQRQLRR